MFKKQKKHSRAIFAQKSITNRPKEIETREMQGHWEIDCVVSGKGKGLSTLLTLTERSKRYEIIRKIPNKTTKSVVHELDKIERKLGPRKFREIFKSITGDNGSEFMDAVRMERSCINQKKRTIFYYAHPFSSFERGSNKNESGIIRRFVPKGTDIGKISNQQIKEIQDSMNNYPSKLLIGLSENEVLHIMLHEKKSAKNRYLAPFILTSVEVIFQQNPVGYLF